MSAPDTLTVRMSAEVDLAGMPAFLRSLGHISTEHSVRFCTDFLPLDHEGPYDLAYSSELPAAGDIVPDVTPIVTYGNLLHVATHAGLPKGAPHALWKHLRGIVAAGDDIGYAVASTDQLVLAESPYADGKGVEIAGIHAWVVPHIADRAVAHSVRHRGAHAEASALLVAASRLIRADETTPTPYSDDEAAMGIGTSAAALSARYGSGIEDLALTVHTYEALKRAGQTNVFTLSAMTPGELLAIPGISGTRRDEIVAKLGPVVRRYARIMLWDLATEYTSDRDRLPHTE